MASPDAYQQTTVELNAPIEVPLCALEEHEIMPDASSGQPLLAFASKYDEFGLQGNSGPDYDHPQYMGANFQENVAQLDLSPIGSVPDACVSKYSTLTNAVPLFVTSTQPEDQAQLQDQAQAQDQPDSRSNEPTPSNPIQCPICGVVFGRIQERDRHLESYLPHSILCPFQVCTWTGRRQWDFKEHWRGKHPDAPAEDADEIYKPKDFVRSIVGGTPVDEAARSAFARVQESLGRLGKPDVGANVLGRNRELRKWIRIPSSQLN